MHFAVVFIIVAFIYMHVRHQTRTHDARDALQRGHVSKEQLEELCDDRLPCVMTPLDYVAPLIEATNGAAEAMGGEKDECDNGGLRDLGRRDALLRADAHLRPAMTVLVDYAVHPSGSKAGARLHWSHRQFYLCSKGSATVTLFPPRNHKHLHSVPSRDGLSARAAVDVFEPSERHKDAAGKLTPIAVPLVSGDLLYVPPGWWSAVEVDDGGVVLRAEYRTAATLLASAPRIIAVLIGSTGIGESSPLIEVSDAATIDEHASKKVGVDTNIK